MLGVYRETVSMPSTERYGVVSQIRRAAVSVPSNIAEGCSRDAPKDFSHFMRIALGSANEVLYLLILSRALCLVDQKSHDRLVLLVEEVRRMLITLVRKFRPSNF